MYNYQKSEIVSKIIEEKNIPQENIQQDVNIAFKYVIPKNRLL